MIKNKNCLTLWELLALLDDELEQVDVVILNLTVAKEIPSLATLDISHYVDVVDSWLAQFKQVFDIDAGRADECICQRLITTLAV